jgi:hypothetical protein
MESRLSYLSRPITFAPGPHWKAESRPGFALDIGPIMKVLRRSNEDLHWAIRPAGSREELNRFISTAARTPKT